MPIDSAQPAAVSADLNAALQALAASLQPAEPVPAPEQQPFAAFYHS